MIRIIIHLTHNSLACECRYLLCVALLTVSVCPYMPRGTFLAHILTFSPHHFIQTTKITNLASTLNHFVPLLVQRMGVFPFLEPAEEVLAPTAFLFLSQRGGF